ncbi:hypothetical protein AOLI_G00251740 [Acnodon oligacanthus]
MVTGSPKAEHHAIEDANTEACCPLLIHRGSTSADLYQLCNATLPLTPINAVLGIRAHGADTRPAERRWSGVE